MPECLRLLAVAAKEDHVGRLAVTDGDTPLVVPLNFTFHDGERSCSHWSWSAVEIWCRTRWSPSKSTGSRANGPWRGACWCGGWRRQRFLAMLRSGGALPEPFVPEPGHTVLFIRPDVVTGRRFHLVPGESGVRGRCVSAVLPCDRSPTGGPTEARGSELGSGSDPVGGQRLRLATGARPTLRGRRHVERHSRSGGPGGGATGGAGPGRCPRRSGGAARRGRNLVRLLQWPAIGVADVVVADSRWIRTCRSRRKCECTTTAPTWARRRPARRGASSGCWRSCGDVACTLLMSLF